MTPRELLEAFETLADAPDGVKRLRELVLRLAVRGKLIPQDPADEPVDTLLSALATARSLTTTREIELAHEQDLPPGWKLVPFGRTHINRDAERIPLSREERSLRQGAFDYYGASGVIDNIDNYLFDKPLLLIGEDGANLVLRSTPIAYMARGRYWVNNHAHVLDSTNEHSLRYLAIFINSINLEPYLTGTAQPKLNQAKLNSIPCPFPPLAEQHRIVARVDELMGLLDRLEAARIVRDDVRRATRDAALAALRDADGTEAFRLAWTRITGQMDALFIAAEDLDPLRRILLQLAVRGRLVAQNPEDEPAFEQLARVTTDRAWRIEGRVRAIASDPSVGAVGNTRTIPSGWTECQLDDIVQLINGRAYAQPELLDAGTPVIRIQNLNGGTSWYYSNLELPDRQYCTQGDLLFAWSASFGPYIWQGARVIYHYHIWKVQLSPAVSVKFMFYVLGALTDEVRAQSHGLAMLHMTKAKMERWPILLPPLAEQHRIVTKMDSLMAVCDELEASLTTGRRLQSQFAAAAVHHLDV